MANINWWTISSDKFVKVFGKYGHITFKKMTKSDSNHRSRGVTISKDAFLRMDDVTIVPASYVELEKNVVLKNYESKIQLTKYCFSSDDKRCDGGLFFFTPSEWLYFWNTIRPNIIKFINE